MPTETDTELFNLYRTMVTAREMDLLEQDFTARGEAFFHVSGAGHEATASISDFLGPQDYLHCHYRDKALMLARGISPEMFFLSLFNKDGSHSRGRQMNAHMSAPELNVLSLVGPVGNSALQAAGIAATIKNRPGEPIVLCSLGDGMTQQGEVLEAIAHTVRSELPVLFLIQDNAFAISTRTSGKTFYEYPSGPAESFYGIPIERIDGRFPRAGRDAFRTIIGSMRTDRRGPAIVVFEVDRLHNHTNADDQRMYRSADEIAAVAESGDPIRNLQKDLLEAGYSTDALESAISQIRNELAETAARVQRSPEPRPVFNAKAPLPSHLTGEQSEYTGSADSAERLTMIEAIRNVLDYQLHRDKRVSLFGEDIEDPKGDVFGTTRGLTERYGERVQNSPLAEASVIGVSVGRALAGEKPVAFLQFADFLPIAYNQIWAELGSMWWRTGGAWQVPVIVMITCGGYKPGLGPFHASTLEALATHTPGVDVMMPATAGDAAGMLNAAFESGRPTLFFYPKNCLNNRSATTSTDIEKQIVPVGRARYMRRGTDITFVAYGNTVDHCVKAAAALDEAGIESEIIDLRWLSPWDEDLVVRSARKTGRLIVVHEDNKSAGVGAEIVATVAERTDNEVQCRRVTRADTFVPCNFANQLEVLPGYKRTLETAVELFHGEIQWEKPEEAEAGTHLVEAIGSSPSDESVTVVEWRVSPGDQITSGQIVADLEADKAAVELRSPIGGAVGEVLCEEGSMVKVGTPILKVTTTGEDDRSREHLKQVTREEPGTPILTKLSRDRNSRASTDSTVERRKQVTQPIASGDRPSATGKRATVGILGVRAVTGGRTVTNIEISQMCPAWSPEDIVKRTGIETRQWLSSNETAVDLATSASQRVLADCSLSIEDIDLILCATETPEQNTPAVATLVLNRLAAGRDDITPPAFDLNAACSGYLYALQVAYDFLQSEPHKRVLVLTAESLSRRIDTADPNTAPVFGDAASATVITTPLCAGPSAFHATVERPTCAAKGEDGTALRVPARPEDPIYMDGPVVFVEAVNGMMRSMRDACEASGIQLEDLDLVVPHQANQRIINAVRQRLHVPRERMFSNIRHLGNTSSSTIPLCLETIFAEDRPESTVGLVAFGGGYTFAGAILRLR